MHNMLWYYGFGLPGLPLASCSLTSNVLSLSGGVAAFPNLYAGALFFRWNGCLPDTGVFPFHGCSCRGFRASFTYIIDGWPFPLALLFS